MESIRVTREEVERFLSVKTINNYCGCPGSDSGDGFGIGCGYCNGSGYRDGYGYGHGGYSGCGDGHSNGSGDGSGVSEGYGYEDGSGEGGAAESEILYIEDPSEQSGTPRKTADDEEIVADDGNAKNQTSTKANEEEIVIHWDLFKIIHIPIFK